MSKLTLEDLENAVNDERRLGTVGYSERDVAGQTLQDKGNRLVVRTANRLGWTYMQLVAWVDSKYGRWFWDELYGCRDAKAAERTLTLDWMDAHDRSLYGI